MQTIHRAAWLKEAITCIGCVWLFAATPHQAAAQPRIVTQPRNASVLPGQDTEFSVIAVTTPDAAPMTYQWRFAGRELAGATDFRLTITNVTLSHLGHYVVVVRDAKGAVTSAPASLLNARWTELVVFGRSHDMPICSGLVWPDYLANRLGVRLRNFAASVGFNTNLPTTLVRPRITTYLRSNTPTTNTLIAFWQGTVDVIYGRLPVDQAVSNQLALTRLLVDAGARSFLMPTMWPPELIPFWMANPDIYPILTSERIVEFNALLGEGLKTLQAQHALTIYRPDMFALFTAISENPDAYGFQTPLGTDFTCDELHLTTAVHLISSQEFHRSLKPPVRFDSASRRASGDLLLNWSGGSPPFRIERTADLPPQRDDKTGQPTGVFPLGAFGAMNSLTQKPRSSSRGARPRAGVLDCGDEVGEVTAFALCRSSSHLRKRRSSFGPIAALQNLAKFEACSGADAFKSPGGRRSTAAQQSSQGQPDGRLCSLFSGVAVAPAPGGAG